MQRIYTDKAPAAIGPYSQAMVVGNLVFTSGQIPLNPVTGEMEGTNITEQAHRVCKNLEAVLNASGSSLKNAVKTTCFLSDMADFAEVTVSSDLCIDLRGFDLDSGAL